MVPRAHLVHAGGKVTRPAELKRNLLYVIIAEATNMGLGAMAQSCGVPYDVLAWTAEWYFRAETLEAANAAIVNYHHRLPLAQAFGTGTLSSSDGQRFPVKGKSLTARHLSRYFARGQGISTYTHASDQHSTFDTKVIVATAPESHYVLDGILGNQTDLPVTEHATDTHGATLANFALFDLVGLQLSPRIRDLGKITLYRTGPRAEFAARYPTAGKLLTRRLNEALITDMWDDLLRVAASVKGGHATAALVVGKLCSSRRQQNALAVAIRSTGPCGAPSTPLITISPTSGCAARSTPDCRSSRTGTPPTTKSTTAAKASSPVPTASMPRCPCSPSTCCNRRWCSSIPSSCKRSCVIRRGPGSSPGRTGGACHRCSGRTSIYGRFRLDMETALTSPERDAPSRRKEDRNRIER